MIDKMFKKKRENRTELLQESPHEEEDSKINDDEDTNHRVLEIQ